MAYMTQEMATESERPVLCCDPEPDSRRQITEKLDSFGYSVLSTGNPQIASALIQEQSFAALVVSLQKMTLSAISVAIEARRLKPNLPIVVLFNEHGLYSLPTGLADLVLVKPSDHTFRESLRVLAAPRQPASLAS